VRKEILFFCVVVYASGQMSMFVVLPVEKLASAVCDVGTP
jgi:hypothetical protein